MIQYLELIKIKDFEMFYLLADSFASHKFQISTKTSESVNINYGKDLKKGDAHQSIRTSKVIKPARKKYKLKTIK